jgi:3-hydroxyisobutyrate dehydrogenase-like beta-hydroxyacid dehydrogenase
MKIGVIGIGKMGRPIAANLLKAGHSVVVYNRTLARAASLEANGAHVAQRVSEACQADVVLTLLADDSAVETVVFQSEEFFPSFRADQIHVSMGTISINMVRKLTEAHARRGGRFISAPVFGRPESAVAASLSIVAAGPADAIARVSTIFTAIGTKVFIAGEEPFQANTIKLCGNFLLLTAIEGLAESVAFARDHGITPSLLLNILTETLFTAPYEMWTPASNSLSPGLGLWTNVGAGSSATVSMIVGVGEPLASSIYAESASGPQKQRSAIAIPTQISENLGPITQLNGNAFQCGGVVAVDLGNEGYAYCATLKTLDKSRHFINNQQFLLWETIQQGAHSANPPVSHTSQGYGVGPTPDGLFHDNIAFYDYPNAPQIGAYAFYKQFLTVTNKLKAYNNLRINCQDLVWNKATVIDITSTPNATCQ